MFTAIVGRFLISLAAWRLECGVEVAAVEYLAGSRTVFGTISTPFRLKLLHRTLPVVLVLWSLSPLGGQASLRVVYPGPMNYTVPISYTNSLTPSEKIRGGGRGGDSSTTGSQVFFAALLSPPLTNEGRQDIFGNLNVPLVEQSSVPLRGLTPDEDNWYFIGSGPSDDRETITYSSLIGLYVSTKGSRGGVDHFFNIETSYLYSDCSLKKSDDPVSKLIWEKESEGS